MGQLDLSAQCQRFRCLDGKRVTSDPLPGPAKTALTPLQLYQSPQNEPVQINDSFSFYSIRRMSLPSRFVLARLCLSPKPAQVNFH
jgi:hypothetical protein